MMSSAVIDHAGLVGYPIRPMTLMRGAGIALLLLGVLLIERSTAGVVQG